MEYFKSLIALTIVLLLMGCSYGPSTKEMAAASYGERPVNYGKTIKEYMEVHLKDPESAQFKVSEPATGWWQDTVFGKKHYGWRILVLVNAKNSFGAFTGFQPYYFCYEDGKLHYIITPEIMGPGVK